MNTGRPDLPPVAHAARRRFWGALLWSNRDLLWSLAWRDFSARYKGSVLGVAWAVLTPLLMLLVYTLVFGVALRARWSSHSGDQLEFARILFAGIITHAFFGDCLARAPVAVLNQPGFVKKVVFPLEVLPASLALSALLQFGVSFVVLLGVCVVTAAPLAPTAVLMPVVLLPLCLFNLGMAALLAALGVYLRDLAQGCVMLVTVTLFLSPVFYPVENLPPAFHRLVIWNPVTFPVTALRAALFGTQPVNWLAWALNLVAGLAMLQAGYWVFQRIRQGFADVL